MTESAEHYRRALERIHETLHICDLPTRAIFAQIVGIAEEALGVPESERIKFSPTPQSPSYPEALWTTRYVCSSRLVPSPWRPSAGVFTAGSRVVRLEPVENACPLDSP